jgi:type IV pilus assembly protein PilE
MKVCEKRFLNRRSSSLGFTLVEVIVVVVILGILATISIPAYNNYIKKSRKAEAKTNLSSLSVLVEEYNSIYGRYCPACTDNNAHTYQYIENDAGTATTDTITKNAPVATDRWLDFRPKQASSGGAVAYNYSISATSNTSYTLTATPVTSRYVVNETLTLAEDGTKQKIVGGVSSSGW